MVLFFERDPEGEVAFHMYLFSQEGFWSSGSRHNLSKPSQYNISVELPWSTRTILISYSLYLMAMNMGSSLCGWTSNASSYENMTTTSGTFWLVISRILFILRTWRAYLLWENLVSPPLENPLDMVLRMWCIACSPSSHDVILALPDPRLLVSSRSHRLCHSDWLEGTPLNKDLSFTCEV